MADSGKKEKVILAYSGGLDTSIILVWLIEQGFDVVCFCANVGQEEDYSAAREKALKLGASAVYIEDLQKEFIEEFIFPAIQYNAIYESRYLLGTSLARPVIARAQVRIAQKEGAKYLAHGATGKGNDQVRFELSAYALDPTLKIIAPWRDPAFFGRFKGRSDLLAYGREKGIPLPEGERPPYSMDENLMHISYESGELENPAVKGREEMYRKTLPMKEWADEPETIRIHFKDGLPIRVVDAAGVETTGSVELFNLLNEKGRKHGIGRVDIVENRFVGIKSRGVYETPGATILRTAHLDIEGVSMDREVVRLRDMLSLQFSTLVYNGFWFAPEMEFLLHALTKAQEYVDGWVDVLLYKGNSMATARESPNGLYNADLASMEEVSAFDPVDSGGFIRINSIRLKAHRAIMLARTSPEGTVVGNFKAE